MTLPSDSNLPPAEGAHTQPTLALPELRTGEVNSDGKTLEGSDDSQTLVKGESLPSVPGFKLLRVLGSGGMGIVYLAQQESPRRLVAVKMIRGGAFAGEQERERLEAEANAIAALNHPHIVQIYLVDQIAGLPFLVLEYCSGGSLQDRLRKQLPTPVDAARMVQMLALAMEEVHSRAKLIHRDLKPGNVLLTEDGQVKVTDFGLAKAHENDGSLSGRVMGTPSYMSPEQARGAAVDPRSDVYSLGAILYECLTGRAPFIGAGVPQTLLQVIEEDAVPVRRLVKTVPGDLAVICHKCLSKEPQRRYASARELADDLGRFLNHEPIRARSTGWLERAWIWCRRNRALAALGVVAILALLTVLGTAFYFTARLAVAREQEQFAKLREQDAGRLAATQRFFALRMAARERSARRSLSWTAANQQDLRQAALLAAADDHQPDLRTEWLHARSAVDVIPRESLRPVERPYSLGADPRGRWMAIGERGASAAALAGLPMRVVLVDHRTGETVRTLKATQQVLWKGLNPLPDHVDCVSFSPDGRWLAAGTRSGLVQVWDLNAALDTPLGSWSAGKGAVPQVAFSPDSRWVYASCVENDRLECREVGTWKVLGQANDARRFAVHPQWGTILTANGAGLQAGLTGPVRPAGEPLGTVVSIAPNGTWFAAGRKQVVQILDARSCLDVLTLRAGRGENTMSGGIGEVEISPDGTLILVLSSQASQLRLYAAVDGQLIATLSLPSECERAVFGPDSRSLWIPADREVLRYEIVQPEFGQAIALRGSECQAIAWHPGGQAWALGRLQLNEMPAPELGLEIYDRATLSGDPVRVESGCGFYSGTPRKRLAFQSQGLLCALNWDAYKQQLLRRYDPAGNRPPQESVITQPSSGKSAPIDDLVVDREDHRWMLAQSGAILAIERDTPEVWSRWEQVNLGQGRRDASSLAVSARWVVAGGADGAVRIFPREKGRLHEKAVTQLTATQLLETAISHDERWCVLTDDTRRFYIVEIPTGKTLFTSQPRGNSLAALAMGAGGIFALATQDGAIELWHWSGSTANLCLTLTHDGPVAEMSMSPDGLVLLTRGTPSHGVRSWELDRIWAALSADGLGAWLPKLTPNPLPPTAPWKRSPLPAQPKLPDRGLLAECYTDRLCQYRTSTRSQRLSWGPKDVAQEPEVRSIRWTGFLIVPADGDYDVAVFRPVPGSTRLWVDGMLRIDQVCVGATAPVIGTTLRLKAGPVPIRMEACLEPQADIELKWKPTGAPEYDRIPVAALAPPRPEGK